MSSTNYPLFFLLFEKYIRFVLFVRLSTYNQFISGHKISRDNFNLIDVFPLKNLHNITKSVREGFKTFFLKLWKTPLKILTPSPPIMEKK